MNGNAGAHKLAEITPSAATTERNTIRLIIQKILVPIN
jgi:hypothetical protein